MDSCFQKQVISCRASDGMEGGKGEVLCALGTAQRKGERIQGRHERGGKVQAVNVFCTPGSIFHSFRCSRSKVNSTFARVGGV